jgi:dolichyl-phosphate-mannose--protein O-mannosyl transferase
MAKRDIPAIIAITVALGASSFFGLGDTIAPQTFYKFTAYEPAATIELAQVTHIKSMMYYTGLYIGNYSLDYSADGVTWYGQSAFPGHKYPMEQSHANVFKWRYTDIAPEGIDARYLRITAEGAPIELGEIAIFDENGNYVQPYGSAGALFDERGTVPPAPSYMNGMYFDEIYHGRTAYEAIRGDIYPYETVHPPLGKTLISIGISLFGMTPFGWRVVGTLFGVAMLPVLYILLKNMFGKTLVATCGTLLFGFDFMRLTQTRIATVDTYAVFFILLSYLFMYRYIATPHDKPLRSALRPLALCGVTFGIGVACKWVVLYAGAGLLAIYVIHMITQYKYFYEDGEPGVYSRRVIKILLVSALFFLVIPIIIYILSYIPFGTARKLDQNGSMLLNPEYYKLVLKAQKNMFSYHNSLVAEHPYSSRWYQWIIDARPMLYYLDTSLGGGMKSAFAAFGNPVVWWGGFLAIIAVGVRAVTRRDTRGLIIVIGYFAQLAPWLLVSRIVFVYHYFPSTIFLVLALSYTFDFVLESARAYRKTAVIAVTAAAGVLFAAFYPALTGLPVTEFYTRHFLKWLPSWPL